MSLSAIEPRRLGAHYRGVKQRLREPPNAKPDTGIDLKQKPVAHLFVPTVTMIPAPEPVAEPVPEKAKEPVAQEEVIDLPQFIHPNPVFKMPRKHPAVADIQRTVAFKFSVSVADLVSERREKPIIMPRQIAIYLVRKLTPMSLVEIGRRFGHRDHATILHSVRKIEHLRATNTDLSVAIAHLEIELEEQRLAGGVSAAFNIAV